MNKIDPAEYFARSFFDVVPLIRLRLMRRLAGPFFWNAYKQKILADQMFALERKLYLHGRMEENNCLDLVRMLMSLDDGRWMKIGEFEMVECKFMWAACCEMFVKEKPVVNDSGSHWRMCIKLKFKRIKNT